MLRIIVTAFAVSFALSTGVAVAQSARTNAARQAPVERVRAQPMPIDPNSDLAKAQAAIAQGFAPIDTSQLGRGFSR